MADAIDTDAFSATRQMQAPAYAFDANLQVLRDITTEPLPQSHGQDVRVSNELLVRWMVEVRRHAGNI